MATEINPLTWVQSNEPRHATVDDQLPGEVVTCLQNARFLHLATCTHNIPHVSLMNYTYLPSHPFPSTSILPSGPTIIMTTNPDSKKTANLVMNPAVSLLVHEWVSSRPSNANSSGSGRDRSPPGVPRSSLAAMLMSMNSTAVSSISATINGEALVMPVGSAEEAWCKDQHLANNTFTTDQSPVVTRAAAAAATASEGTEDGGGDGGRGSYIEDQNVRVIVVKIRDGRISDWKGGVKDFVLASKGTVGADLVNGDGAGAPAL